MLTLASPRPCTSPVRARCSHALLLLCTCCAARSQLVAKLIHAYRPDMPALRIDNNPILPAGMIAIAETLKNNEDIREVHCRYCGIGPSGMAAIAATLSVNNCCDALAVADTHSALELKEVKPNPRNLTLIRIPRANLILTLVLVKS